MARLQNNIKNTKFEVGMDGVHGQIRDSFRSISSPARGLFKDNGSRFIACAYPVETEAEVKEIVDSLKKEYHDARHHCYAYRLGYLGDRFRANDDGEPSGSAGRPILGQIDSYGLSDILIVVVRYFGGIKLGIPGLIRAYRTSSADAIANSEVVEKIAVRRFRLSFGYMDMNAVMKLVKDFGLSPTAQDFRANAVTGNLGFGTLDVTKNTAYSFDANNVALEELEDYTLYLWLTDIGGGQSSRVESLDFTTVDRTPPRFNTDATVNEVERTSVGLYANLNEVGTLFWVGVPQGEEYAVNLFNLDYYTTLSDPDYDRLQADLEAAAVSYRLAIRENPFAEDIPLLVGNVTVIRNGKGFNLLDQTGHAVPLKIAEETYIDILAITGGAPFSTFLLANDDIWELKSIWYKTKYHTWKDEHN